ncbi:MAG: BlaI/MecI/CopY family transcriptional regulator [Thermoanaerobaculia bacterium]
MKPDPLGTLSRRERQIMEVVYRDGRVSANEVLERIPEAPGYSAVRALLKVLENKGHLKHVLEGTRYVYLPTFPADRARRSALKSLLETFFEGSAEKAMAALISIGKDDLSTNDLDRLSQLIDQAKEEGR